VNGEVIFQAVRSGKAPQTIIKNIRENILNGKLNPGDKLPPEHELLKSFSVSRQTLREALRVLEMQGFLQIRVGAKGGTFVAEVNMDVTKDSLINFLHYKKLTISHLAVARHLLEPYFASIAAKNMTDAEIAELEELLKQAKNSLNDGDIETLRKKEVQFHRLLAQVSQNPLLILIHDFIESLLEDTKRILNPDIEFSHRVMEMHEKIFKAIKEHDSEAASKLIIDDITMVGDILQKLAKEQDIIK